MTRITFDTVRDFRDYLKGLVAEIRETIKQKDQSAHSYASWKYRHYHVAYCMLRGTEYCKIEAKVREGNEPDWNVINNLIDNNQGIKHVPRFEKSINCNS